MSNEYTNQIRALAECLQEGENIPTASVVITLNEAADKIDYLGSLLEKKCKQKPDGYVWLDGYHCSHISIVKPPYVTARPFVYVEENV